MLQNSRPTLADVSCSSPVPRLSPPGSLSLDDLSHLTAEFRPGPAGRTDVSSDGASSCSDLSTGGKTQPSLGEVDRRKRRRENNKAAAAKCRKKKKDRTEYLLLESEKLESVNINLKAQIKALNQQKQQLSHMLNQHRPTCIVRAHNGRTPDHETAELFARHLRESPSSLFAVQDAAAIFGPSELDAGALLGLDHVHCSVSM